VPHFSELCAEGAFPGVGISLHGGSLGAEYDLRVAPGADASRLRMKISGADRTRLATNGDLLIESDGVILLMKTPHVFESTEVRPGETPRPQFVAVAGRHVDGGYFIGRHGLIGFRIGQHDSSAGLVIDPALSVEYSTFLGGAGTDTGASVALDSSGTLYIGGVTSSATTFPIGAGTVMGPGVGSGSGTTQFYIAKIDPQLNGPSSLIYLTFIGGSATQTGGLIAIDSSGDVAITGTTTAPDYPVTDGSQLTSGSNDVPVTQIDPTGSQLLFSTLFGGSGAESQQAQGGITVDSSGNIWIASDTSSIDLPATTGALQTILAGTTTDAFLAVFAPASSPALTYCTYLGANATAQVGGIAVDSTGAGYIAGSVLFVGIGFPFKNAFQAAYGGGNSDAFLVKIMPAGQGASDLIYATLLGGTGTDQALAVALDTATPPNVYVAGTTQSPNFPVNGTIAPYQSSLHTLAMANVFFSEIAQNATTEATSLVYSTYLGGSGTDSGASIAVGAFDAIYVAGTTTSWDFPWHDNLQPFNGSSDAFVAKFNPTVAGAASLIYATPLGGTATAGNVATAAGNGVAADDVGDAYVLGQTNAGDFPTAVSTSGGMNGLQPLCASCSQTPPFE